VLTLALGIGGTTAIFSLIDGIVLRPLPYPGAERLVTVRHAAPGLGLSDAGQSIGTYLHYRTANHAFEQMGAYQESVVNVTDVERPERVQVALVTPSLFDVLGAVPERGRVFTDAEGQGEAGDVVVISHGLWVRHYGADPGILGRTIELNEARYTVVGVMPSGFHFPRPETEVWYPLDVLYRFPPSFAGFYFDAIGRLRPGVSPRDAEADLQGLIAQLPDVLPGLSPERLRDSQLRAVVVPLKRAVLGNLASALWVLLGGVAFLLVIACANVANLFLVRAEHRQREIAVRCALGAARRDIGRTLLAEALLLAMAGVVLGLALADASTAVLLAVGPKLPRLAEVTVDLRAIGFATLLGAFSALALPLVPYLRYRSADLGAALAASRPGNERPDRQALRRGLVSLQIALALMLLVGSALMVRSFLRLSRVDPGFDPDRVLTAEVALPSSPYPMYQAPAAFYGQLLDRIRALPGVTEAGASTLTPLTPIPSYQWMEVDLQPGVPDSLFPRVLMVLATPDYFSTMRVPLVEGRVFGAGDLQGDVHPVIVNRAFARRYFAGAGALGRQVGLRGHTLTVVGVVGDVRHESVTEPAAPTWYLPVLPGAEPDWMPMYPHEMGIAIRTTGPPVTLAPSVRRIVRDLDPNVPVSNVRTMEDIVATSTVRTRFTMVLMLVAALAALFLGAVGVHGVMAYAVRRRTHEMGVRIALGARASELAALVLRQAAWVSAVGLTAGTLGALALTRLLRGLLFEVTPTDPLSFVGTALVLLAATLLASWVPARRATRVDPIEALRYE